MKRCDKVYFYKDEFNFEPGFIVGKYYQISETDDSTFAIIYDESGGRKYFFLEGGPPNMNGIFSNHFLSMKMVRKIKLENLNWKK